MSIEEKYLSLPPFCDGKLRGNLNLVIEKIDWKTSKFYHKIKLNILWWGQTEGVSSECCRSSENPLEIIKYTIKTNPSLFQSYLKNCEPLKIEFRSSKTNEFIGTSKIEISSKIKNNFPVKSTGKILSKTNFDLGEITVSINLREMKTLNTSLEFVQKNNSTNSKLSFQLKKSQKEQLNKENMLVETYSRNVVSGNVSEKKDKAIVLPLKTYLSGQSMTAKQEIDVIKTLKDKSPTLSFIESHQEKLRQTPKLTQDCIRIKILNASFHVNTDEDTKLFMMDSIVSKSVVKCAILSKVFEKTDEIKLLSPVITTSPVDSVNTSFLQVAYNRLVPPTKIGTTSFLNFGFSLVSIENPTKFIGFSRIDFKELIKSSGMVKIKSPIVNQNKVVGTMLVRMQLGLYNQALKDQINQENSELIYNSRCFLMNKTKHNFSGKMTSHPSNSNENNETEQNFKIKKRDEKTTASSKDLQEKITKDLEESDACLVVDSQKTKNNSSLKVYQGLLHIGELQTFKEDLSTEYFITYEGFWNECQESTQTSVGRLFNHLKEFPVICNDVFLKKVQNNHLELKLWENNKSKSEKLVGTTKIPLHQFFIAFRDVAMIEHLSLNQLPIISIDTNMNFMSPLSSEIFCKGKVLLAIGSSKQIEFLKITRNLNLLAQSRAQEINSDSPLNSKLSAFIEGLSQKLPSPENTPLQKLSPKPESQPNLKKTSDLLETLQKALLQAPQPPTVTSNEDSAFENFDLNRTTSTTSQDTKVEILVTLEHACHLPKVMKKRQNRRRSKVNVNTIEFEPSSYATFESCLDSQNLDASCLPEDIVNSHEGFVHCTRVIKSVDPKWNHSFDVQLPLDVLTNSQKRFIVKIWRKCSQELGPPAPFEDVVIGFTAVDLSVLLTGLPVLSGYYNITDFSGRCNGQLKMTFKPTKNLADYCSTTTLSQIPAISSSLNYLSGDIFMSDESSNLLSRTLKRKFSELDEITQRLKARLFDVTGDENFDPDDEFERDLNTEVDDNMNEDIQDGVNNFGWLKENSKSNIFGDFSNQSNPNFLNPQPSTSKSTVGSSPSVHTQRIVSGCSDPSAIEISQLLNKYDLDTIINPSLLRNIINPSLAESDSTPNLNSNQTKTPECHGDSGDTTVSSIITNDQEYSIERSLQEKLFLERKGGDGFSE